MKKYARLVLGFVLALFFLWLVLRQLNIEQLKTAFLSANLAYISVAIVIFYIGYACRIQRWKIMLTQENPRLTWSNCAGPLMASVAANNVLPFRAGDFLRVFGFNKRLSISAATSLATLFVERLLDLLMVVGFLGLFLAYFGLESSPVVGVGGSVLLMAGLAILILLLFPAFFRPIAFWICNYISMIYPTLGVRIRVETEKIFSALINTSKGLTMVKLITWSLLAWLFEGFVFWLVALSLPSVTDPMASWLALSIGTLATVIPSTPGYVGTFDYFTAQAMLALGNDVIGAAAFAFLVHLVLWLPPLVAGGTYLLLRPVGHFNYGKN
jgi:glycosyltransferase 2 family protein